MNNQTRRAIPPGALPPLPRRALLGAAALLTVPARRARADMAYPDHTVRIINPFPPGSPFDLLARLAADRLNREWGHPFVVENRSGAGGTIGTAAFTRSAADGYTLLVQSSSMLATTSSLYHALSYDIARDLVPIWAVLTSGFVLIVNPALPVRSLKEFTDYAHANPGRITFGSAGTGTTHHLAGELFMRRTGTTLIHAPYRGAVPAETDLVAGHIDCIFDSAAGVAPMIADGKVRAIAAMRDTRSRILPGIPTAHEAGLDGLSLPVSSLGLYAPTGVPADVPERITEVLTRVVKTDPDVQSRLTEAGMFEGVLTGAEIGRLLMDERDFYADLIRQVGVTLD